MEPWRVPTPTADTSPFKRIFERLADDLPKYEFNDRIPPFHSSYDNWHFFGRRRPTKLSADARAASSSESRPASVRTRSDYDTNTVDEEREQDLWVVARVSVHQLRLEREYKICQALFKSTDADQKYFVRPVEFARLPARRAGDSSLAAFIVEAPGRNYLREVVEFGANFYQGSPDSPQQRPTGTISLLIFLDFARSSSEALEYLHHEHHLVHGEIRADAFHFNRETGVVRMINFGSGVRSFEHGLSSANWARVSSERGVEQKLQFIAPEQTGRLPAEPDARTDIYSLGILFWTMLAGQPAFEGKSPLDIMQSKLSRRLPPVTSIRADVPDAVSKIIQKMTQRNMDDRYNTITAVKNDLAAIKRILEAGDQEGLANFTVAKTDASCFFNLPSQLVGREQQVASIVEIIEKVAKRSARSAPITRKGLYSLSSNSSIMSGERPDLSLNEDIMSDSTSSTDRENRARLDSIPEMTAPFDLGKRHTVTGAIEIPERKGSIPSSAASVIDESDAKNLDARSTSGSTNHNLESGQRTISTSQTGFEHNAFLRTAQKLKKKGRTELIVIRGSAGSGKSSLVQHIQGTARKHGYFTSSKFDQVKKAPFDPMLRLMASLFRQIFSENDVHTPFHDTLRIMVRPVWPMLHAYLELPLWLLSPITNGTTLNSTTSAIANSATPAAAAAAASLGTAASERKVCSLSSQDWLRSGGGNKTSRFMHIYLDVLRLLSLQKFVCLCLDDMQFADSESVELVTLLVRAHIPIVLILTHRGEDFITAEVKKVMERATVVEVGSFSEDDTAQYVSAALQREKEYCLPLTAVVQERTHGNPFFVREMLDAAHRSGCIYYCWKCGKFEFSLDKLFEEFSSADEDTYSSNDFIVRRMRQLSPDAQSVLVWGGLIGNSFSFSHIKRVMSCACSDLVPQPLVPHKALDAVAGLAVALSSWVVMPTDEEDRFKFSHDRYVSAADALLGALEYERDEMHYMLAAAMMKHDPYDPVLHPSKKLFEQARHVCEGLPAIIKRAEDKRPFRDLLFQAAETAREAGARASGLMYFQKCMALLPDDPWTDSAKDGTYAETILIKTRAAEAYWYTGQYAEASNLLDDIFAHARDPFDAAPAAIIRSRMFAVRGDADTAFSSLRASMAAMGVEMHNWSWEQCDAEYMRLIPLLEANPPNLEEASNPVPDRNLITLGALLTELVSACYWSDTRLWAESTLTIMRLYLERGLFPQVGLGYVNLAALCIWRFNMVNAAMKFGDHALGIFSLYTNEMYTVGRGLTMHTMFLGHIEKELHGSFDKLDKALHAAASAGDRVLHLMGIGVLCAWKLWTSSEDVAEIEAYIASATEEFPDWRENLRGGPFLVGCRQYLRAMAGKTNARHANEVMCDEHHSSAAYTAFIKKHASSPNRPLSIYNSYRLSAMYRFGHYNEAREFGEQIIEQVDELLCMRYVYSALFYLAMSTMACIREAPDREDREEMLEKVAHYRGKIEMIASVNPVNYFCWLKLLDAEFMDINQRYGEVHANYEAAINHAVVQGAAMDEAMSLELYADWLVRQGATRPARGTLQECIAVYRRLGAHGKADHVSERYSFLLFYGERNQSMVNAGTQTTAELGVGAPYEDGLHRMASQHGTQSSEDRTAEWLDPQSHASFAPHNKEAASTALSSAAGLDMIDLAGILESSQLLSSELNVEKLLTKLTSIIVDSTGAELVGLVVENDNNEWCVASIGSPEGTQAPEQGIPLNNVEDPIAKQVTLYVLRFKEQVFLRNVLDDERFSNVPDSWLEKKPEGASMIALPILHGDNVLLGSLYCEAPPNSFTERTVTLLKLLVNQIAISIANALLFKRAEKVQASNTSMLEVQKQALAQARESEKKAKIAEAKAMEMVRLKEEAAKAKSMFLANVSHELRTPLNGVIGMSEMLKSTPLSKEQEEHADSIRVCADTLLSVINDILDFSKLEAGKMQVFSVPLSLTETISEVVRALSYTNIERNLETVQELDLDPDLVVMGDPVRLHQILMNLMSNAYKFTAKGRVTVRCFVVSEDQENIKVTVEVADTGIGITEEQQKKLFLPFSQADSSTARSYGGTGLGLSICKAILENIMGGTIWLRSKPGVGTTVSFSVPFKKVSASDVDPKGTTPNSRDTDPMAMFSPPATDDAPGARAIGSLAGIPRDQLKVCIAEDNPINQKIAINFVSVLFTTPWTSSLTFIPQVKRLGFNCEAYGDGQQAVDALARASQEGNPFHLVLMDVQMPVLDGYNATREIRKSSDPNVSQVLVIAMTASAIRGDREKCLEAGMNNYLAKPVRADTLKQMLESYLHQPSKSMPNLQAEADSLVNTVVSEEEDAVAKKAPRRPKSAHTNTEIHLTSDELAKKPQAQAKMRAQMKAVEQQLKDLQTDATKNESSLTKQSANGTIDGERKKP